MSVTAMPTTGATDATTEEAKGGGKKKKIIIGLVLLLVIAFVGYKFLVPHPPAPPEKGKVVAMEPIQINLASEHYLRMAIALQLTTKAKEADGSQALDTVIDTFSGLPMAEVTNPAKRRALKKELTHKLEKLYEDEVMGVYFTEFVTQ